MYTYGFHPFFRCFQRTSGQHDNKLIPAYPCKYIRLSQAGTKLFCKAYKVEIPCMMALPVINLFEEVQIYKYKRKRFLLLQKKSYSFRGVAPCKDSGH